MGKLPWTLLLIASMAGIAAFYPIVKTFNGAVDPYLIAFLRFSIASIVLVPVMIHQHSLYLPQKRDWPFFTFIAFCAVAPTALIAMGIESTNSVVAAILTNSNSLIVAIFAVTFIGEEISRRKIIGLGLGFLGVVFIVLNGNNPFVYIDSTYIWGSLILLLAAVLSALSKTYSK